MLKSNLVSIFGANSGIVRRPQGMLTNLFKQIMETRRIGKPKWEYLMGKHLVRLGESIDQSPAGRSSAKRNRTKALGGSTITWNTFIDGIRILNPRKVHFYLKVRDVDGNVFQEEIPLGDNHDLAEWFGDFIYALDIGVEHWTRNLTEFVNGPLASLPANPKRRSTYRGNLSKALGRKKITWKTLERGLIAHKAVEIHCEIHICWIIAEPLIFTCKKLIRQP